MTKEKSGNKERKALPSSKLSLEKQFEVLKTFAVIQQTKGVGSNYKDIASQLGANASAVSDSLKFWSENGLLEGDRGTYVPTSSLINFNQRIQWGDEDSALQIFRDILRDSWFVVELKIKFQVKNKISQDELKQMLGLASKISKKDTVTMTALNNLVELIEKVKIVAKDEDGQYLWNMDSDKERKEISVSDSEDMVQISVGDELYAVAVEEIKEFIISKGKKLSKTIQKVD